MKALMVTPMIDEEHDIFGFTASWVRKLAERLDRLYVITLNYNRQTSLPQNVTVYGLDTRSNRLSKYLYLAGILLRLLPRRQVDVVFCHMYGSFTFLVAPYARLFRVPIVAWYTHGVVSWRLRLVHLLAERMVTASPESLRIESDKVIVTGHGIDTDRFKPVAREEGRGGGKVVLSVGRLSPRKGLETLIEAADILVHQEGGQGLEFQIVGGVPLASQESYYEKLRQMVAERQLGGWVRFVGPVPHSDVVRYYQGCDIFVSTCGIAGIDKVVLEAMACQKPVLVCNEAFVPVLGKYAGELMFNKNDAHDLAGKLAQVLQKDEAARRGLGALLRQIVEREHSLDNLADRLVEVFALARGRR